MKAEARKRTVLIGTVSADWKLSLKIRISGNPLAANAKFFNKVKVRLTIFSGNVLQ